LVVFDLGGIFLNFGIIAIPFLSGNLMPGMITSVFSKLD